MKCCNEERTTAFCPQCGKQLKNDPVLQVLASIRRLKKSALSNADRWERDGFVTGENAAYWQRRIERFRELAEKYQRQIDAIEELHKKASKHE